MRSPDDQRVEVQVEDHQFWLIPGSDGSPAVLMPPSDDSCSDFVNVLGSSVEIVTGIADGPVGVTLTLLDEAPASDPASEWETVAEVSVAPSLGGLVLFSWTAGVLGTAVAASADPTWHALRISARGRGLDYDQVTYEVREEYELEVWPIRSARPPVRVRKDDVADG